MKNIIKKTKKDCANVKHKKGYESAVKDFWRQYDCSELSV